MQNAHEQQAQVYSRSVADAAKAIGIGRSTLWQLIAQKHVRTFRVGKRTLIAENEIRRFVRERMEAAA